MRRSGGILLLLLSLVFFSANAAAQVVEANTQTLAGIFPVASGGAGGLGAALDSFFAGQKDACGFIHHDMQASPLSPLGSWIFHVARMREPLARHDGVVSARRAHKARTLLQAARSQTPLRCAAVDATRSFAGVILRPMHAVIGVRNLLWDAFVERLGPLAARLSE